jgi:hypothetical protein
LQRAGMESTDPAQPDHSEPDASHHSSPSGST